MTALAALSSITKVDLQTEGPIARGRAFVNPEIFLSFYFNQATQTQAFALIKQEQRIWGIDFDAWRGWHLHPIDAPTNHLPIEPPDIPSIIQSLARALSTLEIQ
ncbi:MAG: hypothetical protein FJ009_04445 [Chloroflexi bacterium]|nr:hypothetical protein [Chloroflexota bacterium]